MNIDTIIKKKTYEKEYIIFSSVDVFLPCIFSADNNNIRQRGL